MKLIQFVFLILMTGAVITNEANADEDRASLEKELERLRQDIKQNGEDPLTHYNLGSVYQDLELREEAIAEYQKALRLSPDYAEAHNNLGSVYFEQGKNAKSLIEYEEALRLSPDYAEAHFGLGLLHYMNLENAKAKPHLQRAEELFDQRNELAKRRQVTRILKIMELKARASKESL